MRIFRTTLKTSLLSGLAVVGLMGVAHAELSINPFPVDKPVPPPPEAVVQSVPDYKAPPLLEPIDLTQPPPMAIEQGPAPIQNRKIISNAPELMGVAPKARDLSEAFMPEPEPTLESLPEFDNIDDEPDAAIATVSPAPISREKALLDSLNVPKPGSAYFSDEPYESEEDSAIAMSSSDVSSAQGRMNNIRDAKPAIQDDAFLPDSLSEDYYDDLAPLSASTQDYEPERPVQEAPVLKAQRPAPPMRHDPSKLVRLDLENKTISPMDEAVIASVEPAAASDGMVASSSTLSGWSARAGQSIRLILQEWSERENVELIWNNRNEFSVLDSVELSSGYAEAVSALLDQYQNDQVRPVASLHVDNDTGERTLLVEVEGL